jgi:hypothetical protein
LQLIAVALFVCRENSKDERILAGGTTEQRNRVRPVLAEISDVQPPAHTRPTFVVVVNSHAVIVLLREPLSCCPLLLGQL